MTQETVKVTVEMIFTNDSGEMPDDHELENLIASQMSGNLDPETGLGCMAVDLVRRHKNLDHRDEWTIQLGS